MSSIFARGFYLAKCVEVVFFLLVVLTATFGNVVELFMVIYLYFLRKNGRLFA